MCATKYIDYDHKIVNFFFYYFTKQFSKVRNINLKHVKDDLLIKVSKARLKRKKKQSPKTTHSALIFDKFQN